jgi:4-alpha-glucanotransferase
MKSSGLSRRHAGVLIPLFSLPSTRSWGIGEIGDIAAIAGWLRRAGQDLLQLLPINEMAPGQHSPYSAISAMAIDPIFITLQQMEDFVALGGEQGMDGASREQLEHARSTVTVSYGVVRPLKDRQLRRAFERFAEEEWAKGTARAESLLRYTDAESWWLDDYALYRALHQRDGERPWMEWEQPIRDRDPEALAGARRDLEAEILFFKYLQWVAESQWRRARDMSEPVKLFGDLPFMVDGDSADVWAYQHEFIRDHSVGVPPDAFSATGQNWGLARVRLGRDEVERLRLAAPQGTQELGDLQRLPHRSPGRLLPDVRVPERRPAGVLHAGR